MTWRQLNFVPVLLGNFSPAMSEPQWLIILIFPAPCVPWQRCIRRKWKEKWLNDAPESLVRFLKRRNFYSLKMSSFITMTSFSFVELLPKPPSDASVLVFQCFPPGFAVQKYEAPSYLLPHISTHSVLEKWTNKETSEPENAHDKILLIDANKSNFEYSCEAVIFPIQSVQNDFISLMICHHELCIIIVPVIDMFTSDILSVHNKCTPRCWGHAESKTGTKVRLWAELAGWKVQFGSIACPNRKWAEISL